MAALREQVRFDGDLRGLTCSDPREAVFDRNGTVVEGVDDEIRRCRTADVKLWRPRLHERCGWIRTEQIGTRLRMREGLERRHRIDQGSKSGSCRQLIGRVY